MFSAECRSIIAYFESLGIEGRVTDVNTPGVHAKGGFHYAPGTGGIGTAVDFGLSSPRPDDPRYVSIFDAFLPVANHLAELLCSVPPISYNIKDGLKVGLIDAQHHHNHVHVAVRKGTLLQPPTIKDQAMSNFPNAIDACLIPNWKTAEGQPGVWVLGQDGGVGAYPVGKAPFFGSYDGLPPGQRLGLRHFLRIEADADGKGYTLLADDGDTYHFGG